MHQQHFYAKTFAAFEFSFPLVGQNAQAHGANANTYSDSETPSFSTFSSFNRLWAFDLIYFNCCKHTTHAIFRLVNTRRAWETEQQKVITILFSQKLFLWMWHHFIFAAFSFSWNFSHNFPIFFSFLFLLDIFSSIFYVAEHISYTELPPFPWACFKM